MGNFRGSDILDLLFGSCRGMGHRYDCLDVTETLKVSPRPYALGSGPSRTLVAESGLYKLIMRSDKPIAKAFQDWVTKVVLPAIRKDGAQVIFSYSHQADHLNSPPDPA